MSREKGKAYYVNIGKGGTSLKYATGDFTSRIRQTYGSGLSDHLDDMATGCFVVDVRPSVEKHGAGVSMSAPLVDPDLEGMELSETTIPENSVIADYFKQRSPSLQAVIQAQENKEEFEFEHGSLDEASPMYSASYWAVYDANVLRKLPDSYTSLKRGYAFQLESGRLFEPFSEMENVEIVEAESTLQEV